MAKESYPLKNNNFILEFNVYLIVLLPHTTRRTFMKNHHEKPHSPELQIGSQEKTDEIHALNEKLTLANEELKITNEELKAYQSQLEELVSIRTSELQKKEESLKYKSSLEKLIAGISTKFFNLSPELVDNSITNSLHEICEFIHADAAFLGEIGYSENGYRLTHVWKNGKITLDQDYFKKAPLSDITWWLEKIHEQHVFTVDYRKKQPGNYSLKNNIHLSGTGVITFVPIVFREILLVLQDSVPPKLTITGTQMKYLFSTRLEKYL